MNLVYLICYETQGKKVKNQSAIGSSNLCLIPGVVERVK